MDTSPESSEATGSYLSLSRLGRGNGGFYLLGLLIILFAWLIAGSLVAVGVSQVLTGAELPPASTPTWQRLTIDLLPSVAMLGGVLVVVRWVLARPARTVVTARPRVSVRRMLVGAGIWGGIMVVISAVGYALAPADYTWSFEASRFIPVAVVTLLLIPLQAGGEEVLFRGYLMQWTTLGFDRRTLSPRTRLIVLAAISGVLFGIPHVINPEAEGAEWYAWLAWFFLGAGWAWVAIVDGRIELAIGAHIANNLMGVLVIGYSNSVLPVESLWTTPVLNLPATIVSSAIAAALFIMITCRGLRPRWGTN